MTQRDAGIGCGRSGQRHPPPSRRTEPQPAGPAVTFPGPGRLTGGRSAGWSRAGCRRPRPSGSSCPGSGLIAASRPGSPPPASCAVTRDQLHRQGAMGRCGMHDGRSTGATAIREDPVRGRCARSGQSVDA